MEASLKDICARILASAGICSDADGPLDVDTEGELVAEILLKVRAIGGEKLRAELVRQALRATNREIGTRIIAESLP